MLRPRFSVAFALALALLAWFWWQRAESQWFCEAARDPSAYEGEWFYTLQEGPDGWLLRHDDLRMRATLSPDTLEGLVRLNRALSARGVTLIVAAQPPRGIALPEGSVADHSPERALAGYRELKSTLMEAGVMSADLAAAALGQSGYFFRRDHHWTPDGARASAEVVADLVRATPTYAALERRRYTTERLGQEAQVGSYGEAVGRACGQNPPAERFTPYRTRRTAPDGTTLFEQTPTPPIALAGTSNSVREDLNFAGFLAQATGLEVLNVSAVGGGPEVALSAFLRSASFAEAPPRFLVWEFATLFDLPSETVFYRQLVPSVAGACSAGESVQRATWAVGGTAPLFEDAPPASFLYLRATDLSLVDFSVDVTYRDGRAEAVRLLRPTRLPNDGRFFLELDGRVRGLSLSLPEDASGEIEARLCP